MITLNEKQPWCKKWWVWLISVIVFSFLIFGIPFLINNCYIKNRGYITVWGGTDVLQFYGSILSFVGTVLLGALALWQNHILAKQNDNYQKILELKDVPVLEIRFTGFSGLMSNPSVKVVNITNNIATNFEIVKCGIKTSENDKYFYEYTIHKRYQSHFKGNDEFAIELRDGEKNLEANNDFLVFEMIFQYTDVYGRVHKKVALKNMKKHDLYDPMTIKTLEM